MAADNSALDSLSENREASRGGSRIADGIIYLILSLVALAVLFPFYNVLVMSFGTPSGVILPSKFDVSSYRLIFQLGGVVKSFFISIFSTIAGTCLSMFITTCAAYALSKKYPGRDVLMGLIVFTMFFGGGLIPYYLLVKNLHLINSYWVLVLPTLMNAFYMIIMLSFFRGYPISLEESAKIDGASEFTILTRIVVPTSTPVIAALSLFYAVDKWNDWWSPLLFMTDVNKYPLQLLTRNLIINFDAILNQTAGAAGAASVLMDKIGVLPDNLKMAVLIFNIIPIMLVYPFLQKYFAKGVMIGSVKG
jgi:putative aldouronate transport system permease protein